MRYFGIHLRSVSQEVLKISILDWSLKITHFRLRPHLTGKWNVEGFSRELYVDGNDLECEGAVELIRLVADNAALEAFEREEAARRKREEEEAMLRGRESLTHPPTPHPPHPPPPHPPHPPTPPPTHPPHPPPPPPTRTKWPPFHRRIFYSMFMNKKFFILIQISLEFAPKCTIDNKAALIQVMAWCRTGDKPLPEPLLTQFTDAYMGR